ncbi:T-cell surface glycoprotein CD4 isoform X2 [Ascaphus truei]|uniref:T-cell surface glycoprotein CD4 isoform X2 n=1 Tax=Ascaphus truei TaxID=8439 RepID=UPI003F59F25D
MPPYAEMSPALRLWLPQVSSKTLPMLAEAGKKILLPCQGNANTDFRWLRDGKLLLRYIKSTRYNSDPSQAHRFSIPSPNTLNFSLEVKDVTLADSGTYTCEVKPENQNIEVIVIQVSVSPSNTLLPSENLKLTLESSPADIPGLHVSWEVGGEEGDGTEKEARHLLVVKNVTIRHRGTYRCHVKIEGEEAQITKNIDVAGFDQDTLYISGSALVHLPWIFNFKVRETPFAGQATLSEGGLSYSQEQAGPFTPTLKLNVSGRAPCWPRMCPSKLTSGMENNLDLTLPKPRGGWYRMEALLKLGERKQNVKKMVCVMTLTVSATPDVAVTLGSNVTLRCEASCAPPEGTLRWHRGDVYREVQGQQNLMFEVTALQETVGVWTCSLYIKGQSRSSANLTLEAAAFLQGSDLLFWGTIGGGVCLLLILVVTVTLLCARCRRRLREQRRAWLIQSIHQDRMCKCKRPSTAPPRLRQKY